MQEARAQVTIDDLPKYSGWPARLLGLERWDERQKTREEILREYEAEKWAPLLARFRDTRAAGSSVGLDAVDDWFGASSENETLVTSEDEWVLMTLTQARHHYLELIASALLRHGKPDTLVELGAGYGGTLLHLLRKPELRGTRAIGLDVCPSGVALMAEIAKAEGQAVEPGACDLASPHVTAYAIPEGSVIYTSYATSCVPELGSAFVERLASLQPALVVQVEPFFEHADASSLIGLLRRRYIELNGYDRGFLTVLRGEAARGRIEVVDERPNVFGVNPLFAASIVVWRPRGA